MPAKSWKDSARNALRYANTVRYDQNGVPYEEFTTDMRHARDATLIIDTMEKIVRSRSDLYQVVDARGIGCLMRVKMTPLGREFSTLLRKSYADIKASFPSHKFHPLLELFNKHVMALPIGCSAIIPSDVPYLNRAIREIREEGKSHDFREKRDGFVRWSRESTKSLLSYIDALYAKHSRMLVIRLDVGYRKVEGSGHALLTHEEVAEHRKRLFGYIRRGYRAKLLGYAWTLEFGRVKGFHYHLLLFFDANQAKSDFLIGEELGYVWCSMATEGMGTFHNCNRNHYANHGIGAVHVAHKDAMDSLRNDVASYLTKPCFYVRHVVKGAHTFDHGNKPKLPKIKRGRPRKHESKQSAVLLPYIEDGRPLWL